MDTLVNFDGAAGVCPISCLWTSKWINYNAPYGEDERERMQTIKEEIKRILNISEGEILFTYSSTHCVEVLDSLFNLYGDFYNHHSVLSHNYGMRDCGKIEIIQLVNPVFGFIFDVKAHADEIHDRGHLAFCDATAAIGKLPVSKIKRAFGTCDGVFFSGYKFGALKGIGVLWVKDEDQLNTMTQGRWGEKKNSSGNFADFDLCVIESLVSALRFSCTEVIIQDLDKISDQIQDVLVNKYGASIITYPKKNHIISKTPSITSYYLKKVNAKAFQNYAAFLGSGTRVLVGLGHSACEKASDYHVAVGFGVSRSMMENVIRISPDVINDLNQRTFNKNFNSVDIFSQVLDEYLEEYV